jgi:predicted RNA binding protein YcfA (HicA-like mRNA interferase family)
MKACGDLLAKARSSPSGLRFSELCVLAECFGWRFNRSRGSHHIYKRTGYVQAMNFQDVGGKAKPYQVRQLLRAIDELHLDQGER